MDALSFLKTNNIKVTSQRLAIIEIFIESNSKFFSADSLYKKLLEKIPTSNLSTVYRNIDILSKKNLLHKITNEEGLGIYSLILIDDHHHHIICKKCGSTKIVEFCPITELQNTLKDSGFSSIEHKLELYGICKKCQLKNK